MLFQIVDDILDVTGTEDALGKPEGSDERHGKRTYVSEYGIDRARRAGGRVPRRRPRRARRRRERLRAEGAPSTTAELEKITDFIYTRSS